MSATASAATSLLGERRGASFVQEQTQLGLHEPGRMPIPRVHSGVHREGNVGRGARHAHDRSWLEENCGQGPLDVRGQLLEGRLDTWWRWLRLGFSSER